MIAAAIAGCSRQGEPTLPVACKEGPRAVQAALVRAPADVSIAGTPLSNCLGRSGDPADLQEVGASYVAVAAELGPAARADPGGPEALRLGYLLGAVRRGAARTQGIHDELLRRLEQELILLDTSSPAFRRGERAGRERG